MAEQFSTIDQILALKSKQQEMVQPVQVKNPAITPGVIIQDNVAGDQNNGVPKTPVDNTSVLQKNQAQLDAFKSRISNYRDPLAASRLHTFNASRVGYNYDRYYEHGKFKELGFSTRRNNEDIYTSKSSFSDDFGRMFGRLGSMIYSAGAEQFKNYGRFGTNGDLESAALQEHNMSIAQSNREGFGAWTTNFISNSAYTLGVAAEMAVEELALIAATAITKNPTVGEFAAVRTATNIGRLSKSVAQMVKLFNKADKAKSFWTATKGFGANVGRAVLPFDDVFVLAKEAANPNSKFNRLSNLAKTTKTFGAFYRGMKEINAVTSESRLESAFAQSDFLDKATEEFRKKEGRDPNPEEMKDIFERSKKAGSAAFMSNVPLIYFSNKIVLDGAIKGFRPLNDILRKGDIKGTFYSISRNAKTGMAELADKGFKMPKFSLSGIKQIPSRFGKVFTADKGLKTLGSGIKYFQANLVEGLQESGQEVVAGAVNDYYLQEYYADLYRDPFLAEHNLASSAITKAIESQFSAQGLDVFASGFLMGGPMQKINNFIFGKGSLAYTKLMDYKNKTNNYETYKKKEKEIFQAQVDAINYVEQNKTEVAKILERNLVEQRNLNKDYEESMSMNDRHSAENAKDEMLYKHIYTLLQTNNYDTFMDSLKDLRNLDPKDLADAFEDSLAGGDVNNKDIHGRLGSVIRKAEGIKKRFELGQKEENPFDYSSIDPDKEPELYAEQRLYHALFEDARRASIFSEYSFDRASERYSSLLNKFANIGYMKNVDPVYLQSLFDRTLQKTHVETLKSEISAYKMGDATDKVKATELESYLEELTSIISEINQYKSSYEHIKRAERDPNQYDKLKERANQIAGTIPVVNENGQMEMFGDTEPDVRLELHHKENLEKAMRKYLALIAKINNAQYKESDADGTIDQLLDLVKLDVDAQYNLQDINRLRDPYAMLRLTQRLKNAYDKVKVKESELRAEAVLQFNQIALQDQFLQWLADHKLFFDPELIQNYLDKNELPSHFIDAENGKRVTPSDPRYQQIIDKLTEIEEMTGRTFSGKPIPQKPAAETQVKPAETTEPEIVTDYSILTPFDNFPDEVKQLLQAAYDKTEKALPIDEWIQNSPEAAAIIENKKQQQPAEPKASIPLIITTQVRQQLYDLGYSKADVDKMKPEDAQDIITKQTTKPQATPATTDTKSETKEEYVNRRKSEIFKQLKDKYPTLITGDTINPMMVQPKYMSSEDIDLAQKVLDTKILELEYDAELNALEGKGVSTKPTKERVSASLASEYPAELAPLFEKRLGVGLNNTYVEVDENNNPVEGSPEWIRATQFLNDKEEEFTGSSVFSDRGNVIDELLRLFFTTKPVMGTNQSFQSFVKEKLNDKNYDRQDLVNFIEEWVKYNIEPSISRLNREGSPLKIAPDIYPDIAETLVTLAEQFKDYEWYSDVPTLYGTINETNVAGTIDLLFVKDGKYYILDTKTSNVNRKEDYDSGDSQYKEKDTLQQNIYAELFRQMTDGKVNPDIYILPITMPVIGNLVSSFVPARSTRNKKVVVTIKLDKYTSDELYDKLPGRRTGMQRAVPEKFRGKIIYAIPGTIDPEIFETYDVVNADDVLAEVLNNRGIDAQSENAGLVAYNSADREGIYDDFVNRLQDMASEGKTIISSNIVFVRRPSVDNLIMSLPSVEKAFSKDVYNNAVKNQPTLNNILQDFVREGETDTKYGIPVLDMLGVEEDKSGFLQDFLNASNASEVLVHVHAYFAATGNLKDIYHILDANGNKIVMTPEVFENQVVNILSNLEKSGKIEKSDKKKVMDVLNSYLKKPTTVSELTQEETTETNQVAENAIDFADNPEAVNKALESADKEDKDKINDDFANNLDCE